MNVAQETNTFAIANIIVHPEYVAEQLYHDIALMKLAKNVLFTDTIYPACLWETKTINFNVATATGYGALSFGQSVFVLMNTIDTIRR